MLMTSAHSGRQDRAAASEAREVLTPASTLVVLKIGATARSRPGRDDDDDDDDLFDEPGATRLAQGGSLPVQRDASIGPGRPVPSNRSRRVFQHITDRLGANASDGRGDIDSLPTGHPRRAVVLR
jgi:hypothetical protein